MRGRRFGRILNSFLLAAGIVLPTAGANAQVNYLDQGPLWNDDARAEFYGKDQGSQMIPLAWLKALRTADGQPFLGDGFARYGYLPNPFAANGLPIGFTAATWRGKEYAGMTCAACHTRDIVADGKTFRVDGGPAITDFQRLLTDMVDAVGRTLSGNAAFREFAEAVLGPAPSASAIAALKQEVTIWHTRESTMKTRAYPTPDLWGLGRLDAVSMIFNRVAGLDLGKPPAYIIEENIALADTPVRYPFLWNAPFQDKTQWPGFADNGNAFFGLIRNVGQAYGVFATFHPKKKLFGEIDYLTDNSVNFQGLIDLEKLVGRIGPPRWPWAIDQEQQTLATRGAQIYAQPAPEGSCYSCHGGQNPEYRPFVPEGQPLYGTPLWNVGTDARELAVTQRKVADGGVLNDKAFLLFFLKFKKCNAPYTNCDKALNLLALSVVNSIFWSGAYKPTIFPGADIRALSEGSTPAPSLRQEFVNAYNLDAVEPSTKGAVYESRVLQGIWAAAPYLHNGSVATLEDLLTPQEQRPVSFKVGPNYDPVRVGLAQDQPGNYLRVTTGCKGKELHSGNSRCGHDFGTKLPPEDKRALIAYLRLL